jgi:hypothetical protein
LKNIVDCLEIRPSLRSVFRVKGVAAGYNTETKEARIYFEMQDELYENVMRSHIVSMMGSSVNVDTFSSSDWETASRAAYWNAIEFGSGDWCCSFVRGVLSAVEPGERGGVEEGLYVFVVFGCC